MADIGIVGLGVMGKSLGLNMVRNGFAVSGMDRSNERRAVFEQAAGPEVSRSTYPDAEGFITSLKAPRMILMMVPAGRAVDDVLTHMRPYLKAGDVLIDGGNSHYRDTARRYRELAAAGLHYVGMGVSGGEQGALHGPSLMPGGDPEAWALIRPVFERIAARTADGRICCRHVGPEGAGHFVKMVHNGIEYADMQLIAEAYALLRTVLNLPLDEIGSLFDEWAAGSLSSYLIEISAGILRARDDSGAFVLNTILDAAGQKGTGRWTTEEALALNVPVPTLAESVLARTLSARKQLRVRAACQLSGPTRASSTDRKAFTRAVRDGLWAAKLCAYAQGFDLLAAASAHHEWKLNLPVIADLWRAGCIIRAALLDDIAKAYTGGRSPIGKPAGPEPVTQTDDPYTRRPSPAELDGQSDPLCARPVGLAGGVSGRWPLGGR